MVVIYLAIEGVAEESSTSVSLTHSICRVSVTHYCEKVIQTQHIPCFTSKDASQHVKNGNTCEINP